MSNVTAMPARAAGPQRVPPHNLQAEESLLGAMLLSSTATATALETCTAEDFYKPAYGHIFEAIQALYGHGGPADPVTVADELRRADLLDAIGGPAVLTDLQSSTPAIGNAGHYARIVEEHALLRRLIGVAGEIAETGYSLPDDVDQAVDTAEQAVYALKTRRRPNDSIHLGNSLTAWTERLEQAVEQGHLIGIRTGFEDLNRLIQGLQPGQLVIVAARPAMGKSALALDISRHAARDGHPTLHVTIEMSVEELQSRAIAAAGHINLEHIRSLHLTDNDWYKISQATAALRDLPLEVVDDGHVDILAIRGHARRAAHKHGRLGLIVVDYLQLMGGRQRHQNRELEVAEIARDLKKLARELQVPVVALSQLNRGLEQRADKRPMLSDLRESGEIENAADAVIFLYRDDYYQHDSKDRGTAELIVAKQRNGPTGTARVAWLAPYTTFANMQRT